MAYSRIYSVDYFTSDIKRNLHITSLMKFFEDMAVRQSESLRVGLDYYEQEKIAWVMLKWDVNVYNYPKYLDEIEVVTIPNAYKGFYANRLFKVYDKNKKLIADGNSIWLFLNTETKRPAKIPKDLINLYQMPSENKIVNIENPIEPKKIEYSKEFKVRYYDIDTNDHVNNVQYIEWALEAIPREIKDNCTLKRLKTFYKKEVNLGDEITSGVEIKKADDKIICNHAISIHKETSCILETYWEK